MAGYQKLNILLKEELDQLREEGKVFSREQFEAEISQAGDSIDELMRIYDRMCNLPTDSSFPYVEPTEYNEIVAASKGSMGTVALPDQDELYKKMYGAWIGRCIGCALGQPVELWPYQSIKTWLEKANAYPLSFYMPTHSRAEAEDNFKLNLTFSTGDHIKYMPTDDDIRYTVHGLKLMKQRGFDWDTYDLAESWVRTFPFRQLRTAENQAYLNFVNIDANGPWGRPEGAAQLLVDHKVNTYLNPYREWIGAQIRIDAYGYVAAGDPHTAAKLAYTDAAFSHVKNGVYGAMFFAAMISAAFGEKNIDSLIQRALAEIPVQSRFYEAMIRTLEITESATDYEDLIMKVNKEFAEYNVVHTINNAALCLAAIKYANGDFHKALTISVMGGLDTDCNGATVGSVMGAFVGIDNIPDSWKAPLNDTLYSEIPDYHPIAISEIARQTLDTHNKLYK